MIKSALFQRVRATKTALSTVLIPEQLKQTVPVMNQQDELTADGQEDSDSEVLPLGSKVA